MIEPRLVAEQPGLDLAQAHRAGQLGVEHGHELAAGAEPALRRVRAVHLNQTVKRIPGSLLENFMKNGILMRHGIAPLMSKTSPDVQTSVESISCALYSKILAGQPCHDPEDPASVPGPEPGYARVIDTPVKGLRVGVLRGFFEHDMPAPPETLRMVAQAIAVLRDLGHKVEDARLPPVQDYNAVGRIIISAEAYAMHEAALKTRLADFSRAFRVRVLSGALLRAADYIAAQRQRSALITTTRAAFEKHDVLLSLPATGAAPVLAEQRHDDGFSRPLLTTVANVAAIPALVVCGGFTAAGLPLGLEFMGPAWSEATLLRLGHQYERASGTRAIRPML